jgi:1-acyl-sn-glycerol-3-phosphate acyltransferase
MTKAEQLHGILRQQGGYRTDPALRPCWADRRLGGLDAWFYARLCEVVVRAAFHARRHGYPESRWAYDGARIFGIAEACGGRVNIEGFGALASAPGPKVFVANHMSMLETMILPPILMADGPLSIVLKDSLLHYPVFGVVIKALNPIAVGRRNPREDLKTVLSEGAARLARGQSICLFPQATRRAAFDPAAFNSLGTKLAARSGAALVPVALRTDFMGIGRALRDFGPIDRSRPIRFRIAPPLRVERGGEREAQQAAVAFIGDTLRAWGLTEQKEGCRP